MKIQLAAVILMLVLACSITIPNAFSDDKDSNKTKDDDKGKPDKVKEHPVFGFSNVNSFNFTLPNGTNIVFSFQNGTKIGKQISAFEHMARDDFKKQRDQSLQVIKQCREQAKNATSPDQRKTIMDDCKVQLKQINQKFKDEHKQFQIVFKNFRDTIIESQKQEHQKPKLNQTSTHIQNQTQILEQKLLDIQQKFQEKQDKLSEQEQKQEDKITEQEQKLQEKLNETS